MFGNRIKTTVIVLFVLLQGAVSITPALADDVKNDLNAWQTINVQIPIAERWRLNSLTQMREKSNLKQADRFLQFIDLNYAFDKKKRWLVGGGYAFTPTFHPSFRDENRTYEQITYQAPLKGGQFMFRNRLEQRFIENAGSMAQWNRSLLQYSHPIGKSSWYWTTWNEVFFQLSNAHNGPTAGFDQNRTFVGVGKNLGKHVRLEAGYMLLYAHHPGASPENLNHTVMTQLTIH